MNLKNDATLAIGCFLSIALASFGWISATTAGTYKEEFDGNKLDENLWVVKAEGDASYKIENGQLTMISPGVGDGFLIYWGELIGNEDFTVEIKASITKEAEGAAVVNFIEEMLPPMLNTTINAKWLSVLWCGTAVGNGWAINDDDWTRTAAVGPEFEGIWKGEIKGDEIRWYFKDEEVIAVPKLAEKRYMCFGPDTYTSHYSGEMTVDWIELSGPAIPDAAVEPVGKLPVRWGKLRREF